MKTLKITTWLEMEASNLELGLKKVLTREELKEILPSRLEAGWRLPTKLEAAMLAELSCLKVGALVEQDLFHWAEYWLAGEITDLIYPTIFISWSISYGGYDFSCMPSDRHCRVRLVRDIKPKS